MRDAPSELTRALSCSLNGILGGASGSLCKLALVLGLGGEMDSVSLSAASRRSFVRRRVSACSRWSYASMTRPVTVAPVRLR